MPKYYPSRETGALNLIRKIEVGNATSIIYIDNVFSSKYDSYKIIIEPTYAFDIYSSTTLDFQLTSSGIPLSNGYYEYAISGITTSGTTDNMYYSYASSYPLGELNYSYAYNNHIFTADIFSPSDGFIKTKILSSAFDGDYGTYCFRNGGGAYDFSEIADGFQISTSNGGIFGTIKIYGYKD